MLVRKGLLIAALFLFIAESNEALEFKIVYYRDCDYFVAKSEIDYCIFEKLNSIDVWENKKFNIDIKSNKRKYIVKFSDNLKENIIYIDYCGDIYQILDRYEELCRSN